MVEEIIKEHVNKTLSSPTSIAEENMQCQPLTSELAKSKDEPKTAEKNKKEDAERSVNENTRDKDEEKGMTEVSAANVRHFYSS